MNHIEEQQSTGLTGLRARTDAAMLSIINVVARYGPSMVQLVGGLLMWMYCGGGAGAPPMILAAATSLSKGIADATLQSLIDRIVSGTEINDQQLADEIRDMIRQLSQAEHAAIRDDLGAMAHTIEGTLTARGFYEAVSKLQRQDEAQTRRSDLVMAEVRRSISELDQDIQAVTRQVSNDIGTRVQVVRLDDYGPADSRSLDNFYKEGVDIWWDIIAANGDIRREQMGALLDAYGDEPTATRLVCLTGISGVGKSTMAWRLAVEICRMNACLLLHFHQASNLDVIVEIETFMRDFGQPAVLLIDDVFTLPGAKRALPSLAPDLPLTVVATSQTHLVPVGFRPRYAHEMVEVAAPTPTEVAQVSSLPGHEPVSEETMRQAVRARTWLDMMCLVNGQEPFEPHVARTMDDLKDSAQIEFKALEYVCMASAYSVQLPASLLEAIDDEFYDLASNPNVEGLVKRRRNNTLAMSSKHFAVMARKAYRRSPAAALAQIIDAANPEKASHRRAVALLLYALCPTESSSVRGALQRADLEPILRQAEPQDLETLALVYDAVGNEYAAQNTRDRMWMAPLSSEHELGQLFRLAARHGSDEQRADVLATAFAWLDDHPEAAHVRAAFLGYVERFGKSGQIAQAMERTMSWLALPTNESDTYIRTALLGFAGRCGPADLARTLSQNTLPWLSRHPNALSVLATFSTLAERLGDDDARTQVGALVKTWLEERPDSAGMRVAWLTSAFASKDNMTISEALDETMDWLIDHRDSGLVRSTLLTHAATHGSDDVKQRLLEDTILWLKENPDDSHIRAGVFSFTSRSKDTATLRELLRDTAQWVREHPDDTRVRGALLHNVAEHGTQRMQRDALQDAVQWLEDPVHEHDHTVRAGLIGLATRIQDRSTRESVFLDTIQWLKRHSEDSLMWQAALGAIGRAGSQDARRDLLQAAQAWLAEHPDDTAVHQAVLGFARRLGDHNLQAKTASEFVRWVDHNAEVGDALDGVMAFVGQHGATDEKTRLLTVAMQWLCDHPWDQQCWDAVVAYCKNYSFITEGMGLSHVLADAIRQMQADELAFGITADALADIGLSLRKQRLNGQARVMLDTALSVEPDHSSAHHNIGLIEKDDNHWDEARRHFEAVGTAIDGDALQAWAGMEADLGQVPAARELYERAMRQARDNSGIPQAWALLESGVGNHPKAIELARHALDMENNHYNHYAMGKVLCAAGDIAGGRRSLESARLAQLAMLRRNRTQPRWANLLARSLIELGDISPARSYLQAALPLCSERDIHFTLKMIGDLRVAEGDVAGARQHYRAALDAHPTYYQARRAIEMLDESTKVS